MAYRIVVLSFQANLKLLASFVVAVMLALPLLAVEPVSVNAAPKAVFLPQIEGTYSVQGLNPNGTRYQGRVVITVKDDTAFFRWDISGQTFHGQGPLNGKTLIIDWGEDDPVIYQINPDGTLFGTWARGKASETLQPLF
jgi:hypothetical protein